MKKENGNKIRLGLFVIGAVVIFLVGIYFIGQKRLLFSSTIKVKTVYRDVNGLQAGNNVRFSGIDVGTVDDITIISDTAVRVTLAIDRSVQKFIKKDAKASIGSEGLMGDKIVNISAGTEGGPEIENGDVVLAMEGSTIDEIMKSVKVTADNAAHITGDLADVVGTIKTGKGTIGKLLMDTVFAGNLDATMVNVKQASGGLKENMEAAKHNFLLKGYFKKKEKEAAKKEKEREKEEKKESNTTPDK